MELNSAVPDIVRADRASQAEFSSYCNEPINPYIVLYVDFALTNKVLLWTHLKFTSLLVPPLGRILNPKSSVPLLFHDPMAANFIIATLSVLKYPFPVVLELIPTVYIKMGIH